MALVEQPDMADGGDSSGSYASPRGGAPGRQGPRGFSAPAWEASKGSGGGGIGGGRTDDAVALVRRAMALGVPPLPPDLGAVRYRRRNMQSDVFAALRSQGCPFSLLSCRLTPVWLPTFFCFLLELRRYCCRAFLPYHLLRSTVETIPQVA